MSFCTACGTEVGNAAFCTKCGAKMSPPPIPVPGASAASAPAKSGGSNVLKIILLVLGGMFLIAVLVIGTGIFFAKKKYDEVSQSIKTETDAAGNTRIETPFGKLEASKDAEKILKDLDIPLYPNAKQVEGGASSMTINRTTISNVQLETPDSMEEVMEFYKVRYPEANFIDNQESKMISLGEQDKRMLVITITKNEGSGITEIHIANTEKR